MVTFCSFVRSFYLHPRELAYEFLLEVFLFMLDTHIHKCSRQKCLGQEERSLLSTFNGIVYQQMIKLVLENPLLS